MSENSTNGTLATPAAIHLPLSELTHRHQELAEHGELLVICKVGARSARATEFLINSGMDAINIEGGMLAWQAAGLEMVSESGQGPTVI